jgi:hypothetical protein
VIGLFIRTVSKTRATFRRLKPAGEPEEDLVNAAGRNSEKVLDRIGRLLVLLLPESTTDVAPRGRAV